MNNLRDYYFYDCPGYIRVKWIEQLKGILDNSEQSGSWSFPSNHARELYKELISRFIASTRHTHTKRESGILKVLDAMNPKEGTSSRQEIFQYINGFNWNGQSVTQNYVPQFVVAPKVEDDPILFQHASEHDIKGLEQSLFQIIKHNTFSNRLLSHLSKTLQDNCGDIQTLDSENNQKLTITLYYKSYIVSIQDLFVILRKAFRWPQKLSKELQNAWLKNLLSLVIDHSQTIKPTFLKQWKLQTHIDNGLFDLETLILSFIQSAKEEIPSIARHWFNSTSSEFLTIIPWGYISIIKPQTIDSLIAHQFPTFGLNENLNLFLSYVVLKTGKPVWHRDLMQDGQLWRAHLSLEKALDYYIQAKDLIS